MIERNLEKSKKKNKMLLVIILLTITLGYALLSATLTINGKSKIEANTWDIHWNNVQVANGSVSIGTDDSAAVITPGDTTEVTYEVTLDKPGDFYEFTVDAVNGGSVDAMIDTITSTYKIGDGAVTTITSNNLPSYLEYSVTYRDGISLARYQELKAGTTETYKVRVGYKRDISNNELVGTNQSIILSFGVEYVQADSNSTAVNHQAVGPIAPAGNYVVSSIDMYIGQAIPNGVNVRSTPALAMADWQDISGNPGDTKPFYLKHTIENDLITESYAEFVITDELKTSLKTANCNSDAACEAKYDALVNGTYTLRGGVNEYSLGIGNQPIYEANVNTIKQAFGTLASDTSVCYYSSSLLHCSLSGLASYSYSSGSVYAGNDIWRCYVESDGYSNCY